MKRIILILQILAILLILTGNFASCGQNQESERNQENEKEPLEVTKYFLTGVNCQWVDLAYDGKIIVINNKTALEKYVTCTEDSYPEIDFAEHTLLLACGGTTNGIQDLSSKLFFKGSKYILEIEIALNDATVVERWQIALITGKLNDKSDVEINVIAIKN